VRRILLRLVLVVALLGGAAGAWSAGVLPCDVVGAHPDCQLLVSGGPVLDTADLLSVTSALPDDPVRVREPAGRLHATTIEVAEADDLAEWWDAVLDPTVELVARDRLVPAGQDLADVARAGASAMVWARTRAADLAMGLTGATGRAVVTFDTDGVGGPSAGLMLALAVAARLAPEDPTAPGLVVAGTGALAADGAVLAVGGVDHKLRAAAALRPDAFLLPVEDLALARRTEVPVPVLLVPVADLADALDAVATLAAGRVPGGAVPLGATTP
jgi:PDZ domain-containing protein